MLRSKQAAAAAAQQQQQQQQPFAPPKSMRNGNNSVPKRYYGRRSMNLIWACLLCVPFLMMVIYQGSSSSKSEVHQQIESPERNRMMLQMEMITTYQSGIHEDDDGNGGYIVQAGEEGEVDEDDDVAENDNNNNNNNDDSSSRSSNNNNDNNNGKNNNNKGKGKNKNNKNIQKAKNDSAPKNKTRAYIHIGPPKTGSTSIETTMESLWYPLFVDNYFQPSLNFAPGNFTGKGVSANVAVCLCHYDDRQCDPNLLKTTFPRFLRKAINRGRNIFLSSEFFYTNRCDFDKMKKLFEGFDVTILFVYRHFHSWFKSIHYQSSVKQIKSGNPTSPIVLFASQPNIDANKEHFSVFRHYEQTFGSKAVKVMDMDSAFKGEGLVPVFFCNLLVPKPAYTCDRIRLNGTDTKNTAIPADYLRIVDEAVRSRLIRMKVTPAQSREAANRCIAEQVQSWWEKKHNRTLADLPQVCISNAQFEYLKNATIQIHSDMAPYVDTNISNQELEANVVEKRSEFCSVEVAAVLRMKGWTAKFPTLASNCD